MPSLSRFALLGLLAATLLLAGPTPGHATGNEGKIDPYLKLQLSGDITGGLARLAGTDNIEVILRASADISPELTALGANVRTVLGDGAIITADVPRWAIGRLAADARVVAVEASKPLHLMETALPPLTEGDAGGGDPLSVSVPEMRVPQVWALTDRNGNAMKGKGVVVGVVDSGIDFKHGDFKDASGKTRVLSIWDQDAAGTGPAGTNFRYGVECTQAQIDANGCVEKDISGHGTHVTSIAAGNGRSTTPAKQIGVAPEADIIFVKYNSDLTAAVTIDAWTYIINKAKALGRPVVINGSWGSSFGAKDGSDPMEVAIDLLSGPGAIFVNAPGNAGGSAVHAKGTVAQGASATIGFNYPTTSPINESFVTVWYPGRDSMSISLKTAAGETVGPVKKGQSTTMTSSDGTKVSIDATTAPYAANGDNFILINLIRASGAGMSGGWSYTLTGDTIAATGQFDSWLAYANGLGGPGSEQFTSNVSNETTMGEPSTAKRNVVMTNYVSRRCFTTANGQEGCTSNAVGDIDPSTSRGPTRDGRQKPEVSAPGSFITAALSADSDAAKASDPEHVFVDPDGVHMVRGGTSMAAPHVTGVVAMMLQKNPTLTPEAALAALTTTTRTDGFTGAVWNPSWGRGKVDAFAAVNAVTAPNPNLPTAPQPTAPANAVTLTSFNTSLAWTNPAGVTQYQVQVVPTNNDGPAVNLIRDIESSFNVEGPVIGTGPYVLLPDITYTWRVRVTKATTSVGENDPNWGPWSADRTFRTPTRTSAGITAVAPAAGAMVPAGVVSLQWANTDKDVFYYEVQLSTDATFETDPSKATASVFWNLVHGGVSTPPNTWKSPALQANTTYFWRVRPRIQGDGRPVAWSPAFSFQTQ